MEIKRQLFNIIKKFKKSILLLGPRQVGKSTLVAALEPDVSINLIHEPTYVEFAANPGRLEEIIAGSKPQAVFIDEIQRLPSLLNTIQSIIDAQKESIIFYLTGSSARKLRRGQANLLPGRIHSFYLGPLSSIELNYQCNTEQALSTGTLPGIYTTDDVAEREKTLRSYSGTYLKEEIQAEALTRNLEGFSRFISVVANASGTFLDFSKLASQAQISRALAVRFFEILEDTLIARRSESFKTGKKTIVQHPRFFFFDTGVLNGLLGNFTASPDRRGLLFEHLVFNQLHATAQAFDVDISISSYRTRGGAEVDFILEKGGEIFAIEAKASTNVGPHDLRGFKSFSEYYKKPYQSFVAYLGSEIREIGGARILPWQILLKEIYD